ncbi:hypothetical protein MXB_3457, partial [Myxobolus squamalis]
KTYDALYLIAYLKSNHAFYVTLTDLKIELNSFFSKDLVRKQTKKSSTDSCDISEYSKELMESNSKISVSFQFHEFIRILKCWKRVILN